MPFYPSIGLFTCATYFRVGRFGLIFFHHNKLVVDGVIVKKKEVKGGGILTGTGNKNRNIREERLFPNVNTLSKH